jgi:CcmD family protein
MMHTLSRIRIAAAVALGLLAALVGPAAAWAADEYEPVNEATRQLTNPNPYILGAYGVIWAAVLVYVVMVARGLGKARAEIETLRRRVGS